MQITREYNNRHTACTGSEAATAPADYSCGRRGRHPAPRAPDKDAATVHEGAQALFPRQRAVVSILRPKLSF